MGFMIRPIRYSFTEIHFAIGISLFKSLGLNGEFNIIFKLLNSLCKITPVEMNGPMGIRTPVSGSEGRKDIQTTSWAQLDYDDY
jgi:hypothetical protein